jgi:hypothetical protein
MASLQEPHVENTVNVAWTNTPLCIFPAFLSFLVPGLGQLVQKRLYAFLGHFTLFFFAAWIPYYVIFFTLFIRDSSDEPIPELGLVVLSVLPFIIVTILVNFLSTLDAANRNQEIHSVFTKPLKILAGILAGVYVVVILGLPSVSRANEAANQLQCRNQMKQIALAFHSYYDVYKSLPPAYTTDIEGKPLHCWRVLLLPYLEEKELYSKIRLNEPWDSEYNRQFHNASVFLFQCPSFGKKHPCLNKNGLCSYSVIIGEETPFPSTKPVSLDQIVDGLSNTILIVERLTPVNWMDPRHEIPFETACRGINHDLYGMGSSHKDGCNIATAYCAVYFWNDNTDT